MKRQKYLQSVVEEVELELMEEVVMVVVSMLLVKMHLVLVVLVEHILVWVNFLLEEKLKQAGQETQILIMILVVVDD